VATPQFDTEIADALVAYSVQHMQTQVGQVVETQHALSQLWQSVLDPNDVPGSFSQFVIGAENLILAARSRGQVTAQQFYQDSRLLAGITSDAPLVPPVEQSVQADLAALYSTGYATAQRQIQRGASVDGALNAAQAATLRAAQRRILDAPRQRLIDLSQADDAAIGWARVGDGDPCYFCAMLIGRGPVYHSRATASFHAHDGCGCNARVVFKNDPSKGWSSDARALHSAWYRADPTKPIGFDNRHASDLNDWRRTYADLRADPTSEVSRTLLGPRTAYAPAA
jgi:hypothetical protein